MQKTTLQYIAHAVIRCPRLILICALLLAGASLWLTTTQLVTNTDQDDLVSESLEYHHRYKEYLRDFGDQEYLYVVVDTKGNVQQSQQFVDALVQRLRGLPGMREVMAKINPTLFTRNALLHLPIEQLEQLASTLGTPGLGLKEITQLRGIDDLFGHLATFMRQPLSTENREQTEQAFTIFANMLDGLIATAESDAPYRSPFTALHQTMSTSPINADGYLMAGGRYLLVLIMPEKNFTTLEVIAEPLASIRKAIEITRSQFPDVVAGLTGRPVLAADEMAVTNRDMMRATLLAFFAVTCIFIIYLRRLARPLMAATALAIGISWTYGLTTLVIGSLNLLSSVFAVILVGAGMEFGLHIVSRYREERVRGIDPQQAIVTTITQTGRGNLTAALTTAIAFFGATFTNFLALQELGIIAGSGILLCLLSMLLVLPAMILCVDQRMASTEQPLRLGISGALLQYMYRFPRVVIGMAIIGTLAAVPGIARLSIDHNLLNLQAEGLESVDFEHRLLEDTNFSTWQAVFVVDSPTQAAATVDRLRQLSTIGQIDSLRDLIPDNTTAKIKIIRAMTADGGKTPDWSLPAPTTQLRPPDFLTALTTLQNELSQLADHALRSGETDAVQALEQLGERVDQLRTFVRRGDVTIINRINQYQAAFMEEMQDYLHILILGLEPSLTSLDTIPATLLQRYVSTSGHFAVYAYPTQDVWDPTALAAFVNDLRSIDPNVTGVPIEVFEASRLLEQSFVHVAMWALAAIFLLVWLDFRSFRSALLAIFPIGLALWWLVGCMGWFGIPFTLANFFAIPILIGLGVDSGVQIMHRVQQDGGYHQALMTQSTGRSVILTSLTTICSFGMLCMAAHRGIQGLGIVMLLGATLIMIAAILVLPALMSFSGVIPATARIQNHAVHAGSPLSRE